MKRRTSLHTLILSSLLVISCSLRESPPDELILRREASRDGQSLRLYTEALEYYYTDRIRLVIEIDRAPDQAPLPSEEIFREEIWGDFRLYDWQQASRNRYILTLLPLKSGRALFRIPADDPFMTPLELSVLSRLTDPAAPQDAEPLPLIENSSPRRYGLLLLLIPAAGLLAGGVFYFRKTQAPAVPAEQSLSELLSQSPDGEEGELCLLFYRQVYRILLRDLAGLHESVHPSLSPAELMSQLEIPSAINQWALRSLYPLLEDWEGYFFSPPEELNIRERHSVHMEILRMWVEYSSSESSG